VVKDLTPKQLSAVERAKNTPELKPILFQKAIGLHWWEAFKAAGFINPAEIPSPIPAKEVGYVSVPFWPITEFLVATSPEAGLESNAAYADEFLNFIRESTTIAKAHSFGNYRAWMQFSKVLCNMPVAKVNMQDLQLVNYWLDDSYERGLVGEILSTNWLPLLVNAQTPHSRALAMGLLESLFRTRTFTKTSSLGERTEIALHFDGWHSKRIVKSAAELVGRTLGFESVSFFQRRLSESLIELGNDSWTSIWRAAIEDHEQNHQADDVGDIFVEGLRDSLLACIENSQEDCEKFVCELLDSPFRTVKRVAVFAIDRRFSSLRGLCRKVLETEYFAESYRHEIWHLLHNHFSEFSDEDKAKVESTILGISEGNEAGVDQPDATAYRRSIWLSAIEMHDEHLAELYRNCIALSGSTPEHPDFSSYMTVGWGGDKSPISLEELRPLSIDQLIAALKNYIEPNCLGEPGIDGLSRALRELVKSDPLKFQDSLSAFLPLDLAYVHAIVESYADLLNEKTPLARSSLWKSILEFCKDLIEQQAFWEIANSSERQRFLANRHWLVSSISRLIENGVKSDENAMPKGLLDECESILKTLLIRQEPEDFPENSDAVSIAINSPRGRALEALINLTLHSARLADKEHKSHGEVWTHFEPLFATEMERANNGEYEFATLVVNYLPNFLYLSKSWTLSQLDKIFDIENRPRWLCAMQAYAYVGTVYEEVYRFLKTKGHFLSALDTQVLNQRVSEKVVQNIAVAFLNDFETLDNEASLLFQLLTRARSSELAQLIWFIWSLRGDRDSKLEKKVFELWPLLIEKIDSSRPDGRKLASKLCDWTVFVKEINEETRPLVSAVVSYAEEDYNSYELLESIARFSDSQPEEAYQLWLQLLEKAQPSFPEEAIQLSLTNIAKHKPDGLRMAKTIVDHYLKAGVQAPDSFLRNLMPS
jgi:hypothetical protein